MEEFSFRLLMLVLISHLAFVEFSLAKTNSTSTGGDRLAADVDRCPAPAPCECEPTTDRLVVNCRQHGLVQVPNFSQSDELVDELTLAKNLLVRLPDDAFHGLRVRRLDLRDNDLVTIDEFAFRGLKDHLEELLIQLDGSAWFPSSAVQPLTGLRVLHVIGYGGSSELPTGALGSFEMLQELHLTDGGLQRLKQSDFTAMSVSLSVLSLSNNPLSNVPTDALTSLRNLRQLYLSGCQISRIEARAFTTAGSHTRTLANRIRLQLIDLSHNELQVRVVVIIILTYLCL